MDQKEIEKRIEEIEKKLENIPTKQEVAEMIAAALANYNNELVRGYNRITSPHYKGNR